MIQQNNAVREYLRRIQLNYKLLIEYDGTKYNGWQKQGNTTNTIQGKIEDVLARMQGHEVEVHGAGQIGRASCRERVFGLV